MFKVGERRPNGGLVGRRGGRKGCQYVCNMQTLAFFKYEYVMGDINRSISFINNVFVSVSYVFWSSVMELLWDGLVKALKIDGYVDEFSI